MSSFYLISPPSQTRIQVAGNDPALEYFTWSRSSVNPVVTYKFKIRKIGGVDYTYPSNNSGADTVIGLRRSMLDSLAAVMGTTGDSVRCTWRVYAFNNGNDSISTQTQFLVTLVRNVIGIHQISAEIPNRFALFENYPNPFNPVTNIKFQLPRVSNVKVTVYDITGKEASVLVNEELNAGTYKADWDATNFSSGIYFYRIEAGSFSDTKKMVVLK